MDNTLIPQSAFDSGLLNREYHSRLILDISRVAEAAGIPMSFIWSPLSQYVGKETLTWVKGLRNSSDYGLAYTQDSGSVPILDRMMAITGACLRNYINAKVIPVQRVLHELKDGKEVTATVALVPNFCQPRGDGKSVAPWEVAALLGWLYTRVAHGQKTVLFVGSMDYLEELYGEAMASHIKTHYTVI